MPCHYLEESGRYRICKARGITPASSHELAVYCYRSPYDCPVYKKYAAGIYQKSFDETVEKGRGDVDLDDVTLR